MMGDPLDRALVDLDESWNQQADDAPPAAEDRGGTNDRTILGVGTPRPTPVATASAPARATAVDAADPFALLQSRPETDEPPALALSEQSPLSFVMRAGEASPVAKKEPSHDMSMFVDGLVAETSPVVKAAPAPPTMEPVMRSSRKRRQWIVASAIAATAIVGAFVGVHLAAKQDAPKIVAKQTPAAAVTPPSPPPAPAIAESPPPAAAAPPTAPAVEEVAAAPPSDPPPTVDVAAAAPKIATKATKSSAPKVAPKKVATATVTKKSSKKSSTKTAVAKKTTAKKSTSTKKKTPTKKPHK